MKKILSLILALIMVLSMCACSGGGSGSKPSLLVGYGRADITPTANTPLGGYGNAAQRLSNGFLDPLYATCMAFTDAAGNTILLFTQDLLGTNSRYTKEARELIASATGISGDNIQFASTHTHSSPSTVADHPAISTFKTMYMQQVVKAAQAALADQSAATLYFGSTQVDGMNFIRHYKLDNGTYAGSNFGDFTSGEIVDHAEDNDPTMQILKIDRTDETKKDILVMNWQAHPCFTDGGGQGTDLSADFIGTCRAYVESQTGCHFAYFQGAAGNHNATSRIESEKHNLSYKEYGEKLGQAMIDALGGLTQAETGNIKTVRSDFTAEHNQEDLDKIEQAREVMNISSTVGTTEATKRAKELGLSSRFHASSIISRAKDANPITIELNAVSIGNFAFIGAPYEMFAANGRYIKENSPAEMTFIISCANESNGYIPSKEAYVYGCYESHTSDFAPGTGEDLQNAFVEMLNSLQG